MIHYISSKRLGVTQVEQIMHEVTELQLSDASREAILKCRQFIEKQFQEPGGPAVYGINTGFGSLCNTHINDKDLSQLQHNLIMSHACGAGEVVPREVVKLMLFLKIQSLCYGHSGVSLELVERLMLFFNKEVFPVIYQQGSLGASGDLAPLAHLALPLLGEGEVNYQGKRISGKELHKELEIKPLQLHAKEGLALINGTQFMLAYGVHLLLESRKLWSWAHYTAALSIDGFDCNMSPFDKRLHLIRPHKGQLDSADLISQLLEGSEIGRNEKINVQDPYSFRCVPQVHGATADTLDFVEKTVMTEINSVTDNPNVFPDSQTIISGGNFHGQPLALALDYLAIAMAEIGNISERRIFQLMGGIRGLPPFLIQNAGLNSGMMILQYTAASIVSQNKQLAHPASVDSIVSSNGQEDHVSMGANAATKAYRVIDNLKTVLGIELLAAAQALEFREEKTSDLLELIIQQLREEVAPYENDRILYTDIEKARRFIEMTQIEIGVN
ncbi:histidine ammonia-lyase [Nonlabens xiamenensis]|uniref:histidine ammonia-lyase n=1 Tax=Nonlabens xiamenensis TaxID=2341043 RepID=UPI000F608DAD|nr:histidine ammonia-lyase [Nonlabens xiamenensis]